MEQWYGNMIRSMENQDSRTEYYTEYAQGKDEKAYQQKVENTHYYRNVSDPYTRTGDGETKSLEDTGDETLNREVA